MKTKKLFVAGLVLISSFLVDACREFPPNDNQEDNDITINNNNNIDIGLPADNSTEQTDIDLSNDSESDSQSDSQSDSESKSSSDNSTSSRTKAGYRVSNFNNITVYDFNMRN
jgi:hypothetical protein